MTAPLVLDPLAELILPRLERVRKAGRGFTARCPAHADKTASLSLALGDKGQALLHCFAGCAVADVLASLGLELSDLYPRRPQDSGPMARAERREVWHAANTRAAARVLAQEARVVEIAARALESGQLLPAPDLARLVEARARIEGAAHALGQSA